jgi:conserved oligomeric Golgi complex subunit 8
MLVQLLAQLRTDLQLPRCLQVVGYLRRMQAFTTPELKLKFLQARDSWLKDILNSIPRQDGK